jgi:hypothetical protein
LISFIGIQRAQEMAIKALLPYSIFLFNKCMKYLGLTLKDNRNMVFMTR